MAEPFLSFVHPDDVEATSRNQAPDEQASVAFENRLRTRDGDYRLIDWTASSRTASCTSWRRTSPPRPRPRDEAEAGIRRSGELHRILTANLPDTTVFLLDHDLRILIADGEAIRRLPWFDEDCSAAAWWPSWTGWCPPTSSSSRSRPTARRCRGSAAASSSSARG